MNFRPFAIAALIAVGAVSASAAKPRKSKPAAQQHAVAVDSLLNQAERLARHYRLDEGSQLLEGIQGRMTDAAQSRTDSLRSYIVSLRNMLERVEKINVIDSLQVPKDRFFLSYPLSADAGRLTLGTGRDSDGATMAFIPPGDREIFWTATDRRGRSRIYTASILDDGTVDSPQMLDLLPGYDLAYPFLMPDGENLYFSARPTAADGDDNTVNIGGYDLYLCRRQTDGTYTTPQNLGLPYNSPFNDYMFAIDEARGIGFFASDRNSPAGKLTVYAFAPNQTRVNYPSDTPNLADIALLRPTTPVSGSNSSGNSSGSGSGSNSSGSSSSNSSGSSSSNSSGSAAAAVPNSVAVSVGALPHSGAAASQQRGAVFNGTQPQAVAGTKGSNAPDAQLFSIAIGGRVYTRLSQFNNPDARTAMTAVIGAERELGQLNSHIDKLRADYRAGRHDLRGDILSAERHRTQLVKELRTLRNRVIQLER